MKLGGWQKTSLIDYPDKLASTIFTLGCNFSCPFCHNKELISPKLFAQSGMRPILEKDFFSFLKKRKKILEGVCITGGEPTLQKDLPLFLKKIKNLGLKVKLDTNASQPQAVRKLIAKNLIDFWAIDFKTSWKNYFSVTGFKKIGKVKETINLLVESNQALEIRTTIVPPLHDQKTLLAMARELKEFKGSFPWVWQSFRPQNTLDPDFEKIKPYPNSEMKKLALKVSFIFPVVFRV